jgi:hypothetical protein
MDYKQKYIKYKQKYLFLKKSIKKLEGGNNENYHNKLKKLYPNIVRDSVIQSDRNFTYGEMTYEGIETLNNILNIAFNCFIDIGSGRGKLPLWYAGLSGVKKTIGIEIVEERHNDALKLKSDLDEFNDITSKVDLICDDIFNIDLSYLHDSDLKILIWISNLCFSQELTDRIFNKLVIELPSGTIIACSKEVSLSLPKIQKYYINNNNIIDIKMTWSDKSQVYLYSIV